MGKRWNIYGCRKGDVVYLRNVAQKIYDKEAMQELQVQLNTNARFRLRRDVEDD